MGIESLRFRSDYWADPEARCAFQAFARDLFALDLGAWEAAGYWDAAYRPFSLFDEAGRVVASVCLYELQLCVAGQMRCVGQLSAVGTRPEWRRLGLARRLSQEALAWSTQRSHAWCYLFSDDEARPLYRGLGFVPMQEQLTTIALTRSRPRGDARPLDPQRVDDREIIHERALRRTPVSRRLCGMSAPLLMFHVLGPLVDALWYVHEFDVVVLARRRGTELTVYDVVGEVIPPLDALYRHLADPQDTRVRIRFEPDLLGDLARLGLPGTEPLLGNNLYVTGAFPWKEPVAFPITAQA